MIKDLYESVKFLKCHILNLVVSPSENGRSFYTIEKGNLIEMIKNKSIVSNNGLDVGAFNLVNTKDSPNICYDKRLIGICQVPQLT